MVDPEVAITHARRLLTGLVGRRRVRHAAVGVASVDGGWSWSDAAGEASPDGAPMGGGTPWFLASVTKLYIAAVVLRLHEQGMVELDAPITAQLPRALVRGLHVLDGVDRTGEITPTHLLGHLTGLPDSLDERPAGGRSLLEEILEDGDRAFSLDDAIARARDLLTPHFAPSDPDAPRARIRYSDTNYQLLMRIAEHAADTTMGELYEQLIFEPLGLIETWLPGDLSRAPSARPATTWLDELPLEDRPLALGSIRDLYATTDDVLRFGRGLFTGRLFAKPGTSALMWHSFRRFGLPRGMAQLRAPSWPIEYGLGTMRFDLPRWLTAGQRIPTLIGHTGSTGSWLWHVPELGLVTAGTVDQTAAATVPFRAVPRALARLDR